MGTHRSRSHALLATLLCWAVVALPARSLAGHPAGEQVAKSAAVADGSAARRPGTVAPQPAASPPTAVEPVADSPHLGPICLALFALALLGLGTAVVSDRPR